MEEELQDHVFLARFKAGTQSFVSRFAILTLLILFLRVCEIVINGLQNGFAKNPAALLLYGMGADILFLAKVSMPLFAIYTLFCLFNRPRAAHVFFTIIGFAICLVQVALLQYFSETLVPLGGDVWQYSGADIMQTVGASGTAVKSVIYLLIFSAIIIAAFIKLPRYIRLNRRGAYVTITLLFLMWMFNPAKWYERQNTGTSEYFRNLGVNKSAFFYAASTQYFFPGKNDVDIYSDSYSGDFENDDDSSAVANHSFVDEYNYPFLHKDETPDVLSAFFDTAKRKPNVVVILVEGLGRAFTNDGAYLGNFTPFIDSIAGKGLYWENFLSAGGRTFAVLPSLAGSLPFGEKGFSELGEKMPQHLSLISLLKYNGYSSAFYYGGDAHFDMMDAFLQKNKIDKIYDQQTYPAGYSKLPGNAQGFTWGYGDKEIFRRVLETNANSSQPYLNIILTVATHSPFFVNEQDYYNNRFDERVAELKLTGEQKETALRYKKQLVSVCYADDALRQFIAAYQKRADFNNTIFVITGDHRMPEIPMKSKIERYHVPLVIYSAMLKRTAKFSSVSTHFDVTPTLLAFLKNRSNIASPSLVSWIGTGIDTARGLRNIHSYPIMQTKNDIVDYIMGGNMINGTSLYAVKNNLELQSMDDADIYSRLNSAFDRYKQKNQKMLEGKKLIPDSIYNKYMPK